MLDVQATIASLADYLVPPVAGVIVDWRNVVERIFVFSYDLRAGLKPAGHGGWDMPPPGPHP